MKAESRGVETTGPVFPMPAVRTPSPVLRVAMAVGGVCFLGAVGTGVWRLAATRGFPVPPIPHLWPPHGHWMVGGFLAVLIMVERMATLPPGWLAWVPFIYVLGALTVHTGGVLPRVLLLLAWLGWFAHRARAFRVYGTLEKPLVEVVAMGLLTLALARPGGLTGRPDVALAGLGAIVGVIAVERMELLLRGRRWGPRLAWAGLLVWMGLLAGSVVWGPVAMPVLGAATALGMGAVLTQDAAVRAGIRWARGRLPAGVRPPLHGFLTGALGVAYGWLAVGVGCMLAWDVLPAATAKDMVYHAVGLGFIFTMILAHAPVILPAMLRGSPVRRVPVLVFALFQGATVLRVVGDVLVAGSPRLWAWTGWPTGVLHAVLFGVYLVAVARQAHVYSGGFPSLSGDEATR